MFFKFKRSIFIFFRLFFNFFTDFLSGVLNKEHENQNKCFWFLRRVTFTIKRKPDGSMSNMLLDMLKSRAVTISFLPEFASKHFQKFMYLYVYVYLTKMPSHSKMWTQNFAIIQIISFPRPTHFLLYLPVPPFGKEKCLLIR